MPHRQSPAPPTVLSLAQLLEQQPSEAPTLPGGTGAGILFVGGEPPVTLKWETFTEAANEAGMSRRYGGIHFARADMAGRKLGGLVADRAWARAQTYLDFASADTDRISAGA